MKRFIILFAVLMLSLAVFSCGKDKENGNDASETEEAVLPDYSYEETDGGVVITKYGADGLSPVVPSEIDGKTVVAIGRSAFERSDVESVTLPDTLKRIEKYAFRQCGYLKEIAVPEGVTEIGVGAFNYCASLCRVELPSTLEIIDENAFGITAIEEMILPENVKSIGKYAFKGCSLLMKFQANDALTEIGERAFEDCSILYDVYLGKNVEKIGKLCFSGCTLLMQLELPEKVTVIPEGMFINTQLSGYTVPDQVTEIGDHAFAYCTKLKEIHIHENVVKIGDDIFGGNRNVTVIGVPDSEAEIYADYNGLDFRSSEG